MYFRKVAHVLKNAQVLNVSAADGFPSNRVLETIDNWCQELVRYAGAELHNIASFAGGVVSQEIIKCVTKQYLPVRNTVVFDGVGSKCAVWEL